MSLTVCLAPARTIDYPQGGGHLWVYLQWALALRAIGCRVIWLEGVDATGDSESKPPRRRLRTDLRDSVLTLKERLAGYGLTDLALVPLGNSPLPDDVTRGCMDLDAAAEADLLLNLWHSLPESAVRRFRRSAFVDTDPGLLQIWMTTGDIRVPPHDAYFTIGETVGTPSARFPDCGLTWLYTPPPVFLEEWPSTPAASGAPYTTVAHWWGGTFEFNGITFSNEKRAAFLEYLDLPTHVSVSLELALCLANHFDEYDRLMGPKGWKLREAWDVSATPEQYRTYIQQSRGEFSCAKPAYATLQTAWVSDRTLCYLASGKPAVVQDTGPSKFLPDADGLFRFKTMEEAVRSFATAEADYGRHSRSARALVEEHCEARKAVTRVLERALDCPLHRARSHGSDLSRALAETGEAGVTELASVLDKTLDSARPGALQRLKKGVYRLQLLEGEHTSVVLKRLDPAVARRTELLAERWLPALGLQDRCARILAVAAERHGRCVWHAYEDLGDETLAVRPTPERLEATVDLVAELHARATRHGVLPDVRHYGGSRGLSYLDDNVRDAVAALERLAASDIETPDEYAGLIDRSLERARALLADMPRRMVVFERAAGPDTLLHGDLWPINVFIPPGRGACLVDWDKVAVGPFSYDLSTLLLRLPRADRAQIVERYLAAMSRSGWPRVTMDDLALLVDSAERARCANRLIWPALALARERADWGFPELAEIERWFENLDASGSYGLGQGRGSEPTRVFASA